MLSSTSSSSRSSFLSPGRAVAVFLAAVVAYGLVIEGVVRTAFDRVSRIQARTAGEHRAALLPPNGRLPVVQLVGNSLLGSGVNPTGLREQLADVADARRFVVEDTGYLDWYFGAKHLIEEGARPAALALVLSESQLLSPGIRGDYSARYLFSLTDTLDAAEAIHADRNRTIDLVLSHLSAFWGVRAEIRSWLLGQLAPAVPEFLHSLRRASAREPAQAAAYELAKARMGAMADVLGRASCELWLVIPPAAARSPLTRVVEQAGRDAGVPVLIPIAPATLDRSKFQDGFHLDGAGAKIFTAALAGSIHRAVARHLTSADDPNGRGLKGPTGDGKAGARWP